VAPLQLYYSALLFAPQNSLVRGKFGEQLDNWITTKPTIEHDWSPCLQTLDGHQNEVNSVAFSHDSKFLASGSDDRTIKIWDTATGSLRQTLESHDGGFVSSVTISHDSKLVASGTSEGIDVWDVATGSLKQTLRNRSDSVKSVAFSQDSKLIASGLDSPIIEIWDAMNGSLKSWLQIPLKNPDDRCRPVNAVAFSRDSKLIVSGLGNGLLVWDATTGSLNKTLDDDDYVLSVAFSHDSSLIVAGSTETFDYGVRDMGPDHNGAIKVYDVATGTLKQKFTRHGTFVYGVAISRDSKLIASAADSWNIKIWDTTTGQLVQSLRCDGTVTSVAFSHDSKLIASGSKDHAVKIWDTTIKPAKKVVGSHTGRINSVAFSDNAALVASASEDEEVKTWDTATWSLQQSMTSINMARSVTFSRDSSLVVNGNWGEIQGRIMVHYAETGEFETQFETYTSSINALALSHDSKLVAFGCYDISIYDMETENYVTSFAHRDDGNLSTIAYSRDSRLIATGWTNKTIVIFNAETGSIEQTFKVGATPYSVSFDVASSHLLTELGSIKLAAPADFDNEGSSEAQTGSEAEPESREAVMLCRGCGLSLDNSWITWNGNNALWLPPDYRPYCLDVSSSGSSSVAPLTATMIAIGCLSGRVFVIGFSESGPLSLSKLR
jgi:WD40 repeat protein